MKQLFILPIITIVLLASCGGANVSEDSTDKDSTAQILDNKSGPVLVEFEAADSLLISANLYEVDPTKPTIILCHQAGYNKFEYAGTAEQLNDLGFNCLAIDQRCGGPIANQRNETWVRAKEQGKAVDYLDAEKDIVAAINYAYEKYQQPVILCGSSYSSDLCIYQAIENDKVSAVIAFSPSNYWHNVRGDLTALMVDFEKPLFFTASQEEIPYVRGILIGRNRTANQILFHPEGEGYHGARALWDTMEGGEEYWLALEEFLENLSESDSMEM